jgi:hypothetical protein
MKMSIPLSLVYQRKHSTPLDALEQNIVLVSGVKFGLVLTDGHFQGTLQTQKGRAATLPPLILDTPCSCAEAG